MGDALRWVGWRGRGVGGGGGGGAALRCEARGGVEKDRVLLGRASAVGWAGMVAYRRVQLYEPIN